MSERLQGDAAPDLVVVGGGINGAGVARDAALRGARVVLVEKYDFGFGSSSRTSKLVHGGVRYLEQRAWRLVREACRERRTLLHLAPHLVRPLPFVFPVYRDSRFGPLKLRAGMWLYDLLAGFANVSPHRMLSPRPGADTWREGLRRDGLRGAALYYDALMDDARLVLANVLGAAEAGARVFNRVEATQLEPAAGGTVRITVRDLEDDSETTWTARGVVLCAGPWTNALFAAIGAGSAPLAPTRGTHLVVRRLAARAFTLAAGRDGRVFFVLPWLEDRTLIGTTDVDDATDPAQVAPTEAEIEYLLAETNHHFPQAGLARRDVLAAFAGQRPLLRAGGAESSRSREHSILEPMPGVLAVVGGKYTTYRAVAEAVVDRIAPRLMGTTLGRCKTATTTLPGGDVDWEPREHWDEGGRFVTAARALAAQAGVAEPLARRWLQQHGTRAGTIAAAVGADAALATPLCTHAPYVRGEAWYAARHEMALRLEDWFLRRSRHGYAACNGADAIDAVAGVFAAVHGWDAGRVRRESEACRVALATLACRPQADPLARSQPQGS